MPNVAGMLDDGLSHPPPTTGSWPYNTFLPADPIGSSYVDPVFGTTVKRLTTDDLDDDIYSRNMWWNADETRYFHQGKIINVVSNTVEYTGVPLASGGGNNEGFDPVDPNVYWYYSGTEIRKITLQGGGSWSDTLFFTAPSTILDLGSSHNWWDNSGRYFVVRYGSEPSIYLYDKLNIGSGPYANPISGASTVDQNGYVGITGDATMLWGAWFPSQGPGGADLCRWTITHGTRTVSSTRNIFYSTGGDHAYAMKGSDGVNYCLTFSASGPNYTMFRVNMALNQAGRTGAQQEADNFQLLPDLAPFYDDFGEITGVSSGALQNWGLVSIYSGDDVFNGGVSPWRRYKQEVIALNIITGEVRRLCHHRSRSPSADYFHVCRASMSWKGKYVAFSSNFNVNAANNVNIFAVQFDLDAGQVDYVLNATQGAYALVGNSAAMQRGVPTSLWFHYRRP